MEAQKPSQSQILTLQVVQQFAQSLMWTPDLNDPMLLKRAQNRCEELWVSHLSRNEVNALKEKLADLYKFALAV